MSRRKSSVPQKRANPAPVPPRNEKVSLRMHVANVLSKINILSLSDELEMVSLLLSILKKEVVSVNEVKAQYLNPRAYMENISFESLMMELVEYKVLYALDVSDSIPFINALQRNLEIRPSSIEGAGNGLFTRVAFANNELVTMYGGIRMSENIYLSNTSVFPPGLDAYLLETPDMFIDGRTNFRLAKELGRWITHSKNRANCKFIVEGEAGKIAIRATRDIEPGEELFLNYGNNYWTQEEEKRLKLGCCVSCGKKVVV